jgi:hypothetical protein
MRAALLAPVVLIATRCGMVAHHAQRSSTDVRWPPVAESTRTQWYRGVEESAAEPVTLGKDDLEAALQRAARNAGVILIRTQYLPQLGDLVTVVDAKHEPLLMLGWTPNLEGSIGEEIAWQADDIHSNVIFGQPFTRSSNRLLQDAFGPALGVEPRNQARQRPVEPSK